MLIRILAAFALCLGVTAANSETPAWCAAERLTPTARTICQNPDLGALEMEMEAALGEALDVTTNVDQGRWLTDRGRCGTDVDCLERAYRNRIIELRLISALGWPEGTGGDADAPAVVAALADILRHAWSSEEAPFTPDPALRLPPPGRDRPDPLAGIEERLPRPWCDAGGLNPAERTICTEPVLSRLDALLALSYGSATAESPDETQQAWLQERNACGTDTLCIARAYAYRIVSLAAPGPRQFSPRQRPPRGAATDIDIPPGHRPPPGQCRVWYPGRPPGQQPPPGDCDVTVPADAVLIEG